VKIQNKLSKLGKFLTAADISRKL